MEWMPGLRRVAVRCDTKNQSWSEWSIPCWVHPRRTRLTRIFCVFGFNVKAEKVGVTQADGNPSFLPDSLLDEVSLVLLQRLDLE